MKQEDDKQPFDHSVYAQLHQIAERALRVESPGNSLQPTLLVNDAYLRLLDQRNVTLDDRSKVLAAGANIIRRILVDYARKRKALKRGGPAGRGISMDSSMIVQDSQLDVIELNDALDSFAQIRPREAKVVELKFFGGLTSEEIADEVGVSVRTVKGDWRFAKAWLYKKMSADDGL